MYCKICQKYESIGTFVTGCRTFKIEGIRAHNTSNSHTKNNLTFQAKYLKPGTSEAERALLSMNKSVVPQLFTDFTWLRDLDEAKGLNIVYTYRNDQRAQEFVAAIATDVRIKDLMSRLHLCNDVNHCFRMRCIYVYFLVSNSSFSFFFSIFYVEVICCF